MIIPYSTRPTIFAIPIRTSHSLPHKSASNLLVPNYIHNHLFIIIITENKGSKDVFSSRSRSRSSSTSLTHTSSYTFTHPNSNSYDNASWSSDSTPSASSLLSQPAFAPECHESSIKHVLKTHSNLPNTHPLTWTPSTRIG